MTDPPAADALDWVGVGVAAGRLGLLPPHPHRAATRASAPSTCRIPRFFIPAPTVNTAHTVSAGEDRNEAACRSSLFRSVGPVWHTVPVQCATRRFFYGYRSPVVVGAA